MANSCENRVRRLAGTVVLTGIGLGIAVNRWFFLLSVFAGANLLQSSFTGVCPAERLLSRCGRDAESARDDTRTT